MKRIFALMICLALAAFMLTACGDDDIYREPGNGTTLGGNVTTAPEPGDDNGSYSADPDGDVSQTTDNDGILEDGIDDIEDGIDQGMDDIGQGLENIGDDISDAAGDENDTGRGTNAPEAANPDDMNGANGVTVTDGGNGAAGTDAMGGANGANGMNGEAGNAAGGTQGTGNGATNGNSH